MDQTEFEELNKGFRCPLCGSNRFKVVVYHGAKDKLAPMSWYNCAGCTVMFQDPARFSVLMQSTHVPGEGHIRAHIEEKPLIGEATPRPLQAWEQSRLGPAPEGKLSPAKD